MFKQLILVALALVGYTKEPDVAQISEAMGHIIGKNLETLGLDFDLEAIVKGLKEESEGKASPLNEEECVEAIAHLQEEKMGDAVDQELQTVDALSNGDQIQDENHTLPAADSPKYR